MFLNLQKYIYVIVIRFIKIILRGNYQKVNQECFVTFLKVFN